VKEAAGNGRGRSGTEAATSVAVVVAAWNVKAHIRNCLRSIEMETKRHPCRVVVVDNGSVDGTSEMIAAEFPRTTVLRNDRNAGFVVATNQGLKRALEAEATPDYLLLLNADVAVRDAAIDRLADFLDERAEAGAAGPGLILPDGRPQTGPGGFAPSARSAFSYFSFIFKLFPGSSRPLFVENRSAFPSPSSSTPAPSFATSDFRPRPVDWLSGACLMVRTAIVREVGLMDESFFIYADDIDWGLRMTRAGNRLYFLPGIRVVHFHGVTAKTIHREINTHWLERLFQYVHRDRGPAEAFLVRMIAAGGFALRAALYSLGAALPPLFTRFAPKARETAVFALFCLGLR
jgi:N-acetylglucosaminyl-diphospho-decaprenol L-rhamnosyltransferase